MFKYPKFAIAFTSLYLLVFALFAPNFSFSVANIVFSLSPLLVVWMAISILKDTTVQVPDNAPDQQWGYLDRPDLSK
jgi:hypothetical protein